MDRLTDSAQGYCEMYCKKYGRCFSDPGDCAFKQEQAMYERLKDFEGIGLEPGEVDQIGRAAKNLALKEEIKKLRLDMSYMTSPNTIGDRHEMGCW